MAHLPPNAAIFSPSVARAAASAAKDWNFVDSWLHAKFHGRSPPAFERNADTLRALLALASANEAADEERQLIAKLEAGALREIVQQRGQEQQQTSSRAHGGEGGEGDGDEPGPNTASDAREAILAAIKDNLSREGTTALDAMATLAVELGMAFAEPQDLGRRMVELAAQLSEVEQTEARVQVLVRYVETEARKVEELVRGLKGDEYRPANSLAKDNLDVQRRIKSMAARVPELREKVAALANSVGMPSLTIEQIRREEEAYQVLLAQKKELDMHVQAFEGLPHDTDLARQELESRRNELRQVTQRRDAIFEGLVEKETPRKPRRGP